MKKKILIPVLLFSTFILSSCNEKPDDNPVYYKVTFNHNYEGAPTPEVKSVLKDDKVTRPSDPVRNEHTFGNWYTESTLDTVYDFDKPVTSDITIYAAWTPDEVVIPVVYHKVTFDYNYEGAPDPRVESVETGNMVPKPADPTGYEGHKFEHWSIDKNGSSEFSFTTEILKDYVLYAHWSEIIIPPVPTYKVTFDFNYLGSPMPTVVTVDEGGTLEGKLPYVAPRATHKFDGWFASVSDKNTPLNEYGKIYADKVFYAHWSLKNTLSITFNYNYDGAPDNVVKTVLEGELVSTVSVSNRDSHRFVGWHTHISNDSPFDFYTPITKDITLYAHWEINVYNVSIRPMMPGYDNIELEIEHGQRVSEPSEEYTYEGYRFLGWSTSMDEYIPYEFDTPVTGSFAIYASWHRILHALVTVYYNYQFDTSDSEQFEVEIGTLLNEPETPEMFKIGDVTYVFSYWATLDNEPFSFATPITEDIFVKAVYEEHSEPVTQVSVNFYLNYTELDNTIFTTKTIIADTSVAEPQVAPTRENYTFLYWSITRSGTSYNFDTIISEGPVSLYARWSLITHEVTYNYNYDGAPENEVIELAQGASIENKEAVRDGYIFGGWYTSEGCTTPFNFSKVISANVTLYAKWIKDLVIYSNLDESDMMDLKLNPRDDEVIEYKVTLDINEASKTYYLRDGIGDPLEFTLLEGTNYVYYRPSGGGDPDFWTHDGKIYIERHLVKLVGAWEEAGSWNAANSEYKLTINPNNDSEYEIHGIPLTTSDQFKFYDIVLDEWVDMAVKGTNPYVNVNEDGNMVVKFDSVYTLYVTINKYYHDLDERYFYQASVWAENDNGSWRTFYVLLDDWWTSAGAHIYINMWRDGFYSYAPYDYDAQKYGLLCETVNHETHPGLVKLSYDTKFNLDGFLFHRVNPDNYANVWNTTDALSFDNTIKGNTVLLTLNGLVWTDNYVFS